MINNILRMHKKAYFFTLDAFIATSIIVIGISLILFARTNKPYEMQTAFLSQDVIDTASSIKIYELSDNEYVNNLTADGNITNTQNTVLEQVGEFCYRGMNSTAGNFTEKVFLRIIPPEYNFQLLIKDGSDILFNYTKGKGMETSRVLISSKNIIFGQINSTMWGPYTSE
ncbi:MAG: hypothetical protein ABIG89_04615, partial [Candidatus Woesearchaeota archaeon]